LLPRLKFGATAGFGLGDETEVASLLENAGATDRCHHGTKLRRHRLGIPMSLADGLRGARADVRDVMRAGLQAAKAGRQIDKPADKLVARHLDAHDDGACRHRRGRGILADFEADGRDRIGWMPMGVHRELLEL